MPHTIRLLAIALACSVLASQPTRADDGVKPAPSSPNFYKSPTDEYVPPARIAPRAQRTSETRRVARRAPSAGAGGTSLTAFIRALPRDVPPSLGDMAPGSGPLTYSYMPQAPAYTDVPHGATDFDGAPCPTRSRTSLGELFACTR
jgi:hypothetical protein